MTEFLRDENGKPIPRKPMSNPERIELADEFDCPRCGDDCHGMRKTAEARIDDRYEQIVANAYRNAAEGSIAFELRQVREERDRLWRALFDAQNHWIHTAEDGKPHAGWQLILTETGAPDGR